MKKLSIIVLSTVLFSGTFVSCKKTLDVNTDPNRPSDVTQKELLPSAEASLCTVVGDYFQIVGGIWSQYWTQSPSSSQYRPLEQYQPEASSTNNAWIELYSGALTDCRKIIQKTDTLANLRNYAAIARLLQAYAFQVATDNFGDIPFTEALRGEDAAITSPHYDNQETVYNGIIALAKAGVAAINDTLGGPGAEDLIYGGDMTRWRKFGNTLLLRMYLRLAYIRPAVAQAGIASLPPSADEYVTMPSETGQLNYSASPGNTNPLYSEMVLLGRTQNLVESATAADNFQDDRLFVFYTSAVGLQQGFYNIKNVGVYGLPGAAVAGIANPSAYGLTEQSVAARPVKLITSYEGNFLLAEAASRGYFPGSAATFFGDGVLASFTEYGLDLADTNITNEIADIVTSFPGSGAQDQLQAIITQKWFAMCGNQNIESYTEFRRTGYPDFFTISKNSRIGNVYPARLPYPDVELTRNLNFPGQKMVTDKVWWDVN